MVKGHLGLESPGFPCKSLFPPRQGSKNGTELLVQELFKEKFIRRALTGAREGTNLLTIVQCLNRCSALKIQKLEKSKTL